MRRITQKSKMRGKVKYYIVLFLLIILGVISFIFSPQGKATYNAIKKACNTVSEKSYLTLGQVETEGRIRTSLTDINKTLQLTQGMPILDIDLRAKQEALLQLPWVKSAVIERHLPTTLFIRIEEKKPIALWQNNGLYFPLDEEGNPIQDNKTILSDLILVVGSDAPEHTIDLIEALKKFEDIHIKVRSAVRIGNRRWNLMLNDAQHGLEILLPETDIETALMRLKQADAEEDIFKKDLQRIDLRQSDRLVVRPKEVKKK